MKQLLTIYLASFLILACDVNTTVEHYDLAIKNIAIIDEEGNLKMNTYDVYINNDTIAGIGYTNAPRRTLSTVEIDGTGKFLLPGFWDNHTHFRGGEGLISQNEKFLEQFINYGITAVRDAGGDLTPQVQQWNTEIAKVDRIGPTIYTSGPKIDGKDARWAGSLEVTSEEDIATALDSLQAINVDYVKLYDSTISGDLYLSIIRQAEARGMITSGHMPFTVTLDETIDAGIDNIEHLYYILKGCSSREKEITEDIKNGKLNFWGSMTQLIASYDEKTAQETFKKLLENNVYVTPTLFIGDVLSYMDEVDHSKDSYIELLEPDFIATYEGRNRSALKASPEAKQNRKDLQVFFLKLAKSLDEVGVKLLAGSDSGAYNSYIYPGPSLHGDLQEMVKAGIPPAHALAAMYNGVTFLKKEGYKLAQGNRADLVVLNSNPLLDMKSTENIHLVIKDGTVVFQE